jgi:hypothetical protein
MKHEGPTRRLFALLLDPDAVEMQAIGAVHEDLVVLGIDAAEAVAVAERLAACARSPAVKLLARLAESDLEVDEGESRAVPDHRLRQAKPAKVPRRARVPRRWIYGLGAAAASLALVTSLNLIGAFSCSWPWPLLPSSRECHLPVNPDRPTVAAVWILNSERVPAALRNSGLQQSDLQELLGKAKFASEGMEIVAIFSVRHPDGTLSDSALLAEVAKAHGVELASEVGYAWTPEAMLAAMKKQRDELARRYGDKNARVVKLQRQIDALRRYIGKRVVFDVSSDTLVALEKVAGPLPDNLVVVDLLPR